MITLIHGPAELLRAEALAELAASVAPDPELVALNTTRLDARAIDLGALRNACDTVPFLAERRLVIAEGLLARLAGSGKGRAKAGAAPAEEPEGEAPQAAGVDKGAAREILAYLEHVPESTDLVLMEEEAASGQALRRIQELARGGRARIVLCDKPKKNDLPEWIRARARRRNLKLDAGAVIDLAEFVGDELRQLDRELDKLADYAAGRAVTREDVRQMVPATRAANVFELVDALGLGDAAKAGRLMKHALDVDLEPPLRLIGLIARQHRLLIQVKALQARGARPPEIARALNVGEWVVPRLATQAARQSFARLEQAMACILDADEAIKTGRLTDREAMDVLLAELAPAGQVATPGRK